MKKVLPVSPHQPRWKTQPEQQDLQHSAQKQDWSGRKACCRSKKSWKRGTGAQRMRLV